MGRPETADGRPPAVSGRVVEPTSGGLVSIDFNAIEPQIAHHHGMGVLADARGHHGRMGACPRDSQITIVALVEMAERCKIGQAISAFDARRPSIRGTEEGAR